DRERPQATEAQPPARVPRRAATTTAPAREPTPSCAKLSPLVAQCDTKAEAVVRRKVPKDQRIGARGNKSHRAFAQLRMLFQPLSSSTLPLWQCSTDQLAEACDPQLSIPR